MVDILCITQVALGSTDPKALFVNSNWSTSTPLGVPNFYLTALIINNLIQLPLRCITWIPRIHRIYFRIIIIRLAGKVYPERTHEKILIACCALPTKAESCPE